MNFCVFPWVHMYFHSDGNTYPCCKLAGDPEYNLGKNSDDLNSLWNNNKMKMLRRSSLKRKLPPACQYHCVDNSNAYNIYVDGKYETLFHTEYIKNTTLEGSFPLNLKVWNVVESNICNFKCAYCSANYSHLHHPKQQIQSAFKSVDEFMNVIIPQIPTMERFYFAGGETHLQPGFKRLLDEFKSRNRLDIAIEYITNMSGYRHGSTDIFEYLNEFKDVTIVASIDTFSHQLEYIRLGARMHQIEENFKQLAKYPNLKVIIQPVVTNLNIGSLWSFLADWIPAHVQSAHTIRPIILTDPQVFHVSTLPTEYKTTVLSNLLTYKSSQRVGLLSFCDDIKFELCQPPKVSLEEFAKTVSELDQDPMRVARKLKFAEIFPEIQKYFEKSTSGNL